MTDKTYRFTDRDKAATAAATIAMMTEDHQKHDILSGRLAGPAYEGHVVTNASGQLVAYFEQDRRDKGVVALKLFDVNTLRASPRTPQGKLLAVAWNRDNGLAPQAERMEFEKMFDLQAARQGGRSGRGRG